MSTSEEQRRFDDQVAKYGLIGVWDLETEILKAWASSFPKASSGPLKNSVFRKDWQEWANEFMSREGRLNLLASAFTAKNIECPKLPQDVSDAIRWAYQIHAPPPTPSALPETPSSSNETAQPVASSSKATPEASTPSPKSLKVSRKREHTSDNEESEPARAKFKSKRRKFVIAARDKAGIQRELKLKRLPTYSQKCSSCQEEDLICLMNPGHPKCLQCLAMSQPCVHPDPLEADEEQRQERNKWPHAVTGIETKLDSLSEGVRSSVEPEPSKSPPKKVSVTTTGAYESLPPWYPNPDKNTATSEEIFYIPISTETSPVPRLTKSSSSTSSSGNSNSSDSSLFTTTSQAFAAYKFGQSLFRPPFSTISPYYTPPDPAPKRIIGGLIANRQHEEVVVKEEVKVQEEIKEVVTDMKSEEEVKEAKEEENILAESPPSCKEKQQEDISDSDEDFDIGEVEAAILEEPLEPDVPTTKDGSIRLPSPLPVTSTPFISINPNSIKQYTEVSIQTIYPEPEQYGDLMERLEKAEAMVEEQAETIQKYGELFVREQKRMKALEHHIAMDKDVRSGYQLELTALKEELKILREGEGGVVGKSHEAVAAVDERASKGRKYCTSLILYTFFVSFYISWNKSNVTDCVNCTIILSSVLLTCRLIEQT
ncbi:hypothetical protein ABKN59_006733 [Abortiporus biennis]